MSLDIDLGDVQRRVVNTMSYFKEDFTTVYLATKFKVPYLAMKSILMDAEKANLVTRNPESGKWRYNF